MKTKQLPPIAQLRNLFIISPESPSGLRWREPGLGRRRDRAGSRMKAGYWRINICGSYYLAHRIVYAMANGAIGIGILDHIDGDKGNNAPTNLRLATRSGNGANKRSHKGSSSQFLGVSWSRRQRIWRAQTRKDGTSHYLGVFANEREAALAYNKAAIELHGEFANLNELEEGR